MATEPVATSTVRPSRPTPVRVRSVGVLAAHLAGGEVDVAERDVLRVDFADVTPDGLARARVRADGDRQDARDLEAAAHGKVRSGHPSTMATVPETGVMFPTRLAPQ